MRLREIELSPQSGAIPAEVAALLADAQRRLRRYDAKFQASIPAFVPSDFEQVYRALDWIASSQLATGRRFLEWGSGIGVVACLAAELGFDAIGIEIEPVAGRDRRIVRSRPRHRRRVRLRQLRPQRGRAVCRHDWRSNLASHGPSRQLRGSRSGAGRFRSDLRLPLAGRRAGHLQPLRKLCCRRHAAAHLPQPGRPAAPTQGQKIGWRIRDGGGRAGVPVRPLHPASCILYPAHMGYRTLRQCVDDLERHRQLVRVDAEVDPRLEIAEIQRRVYAAGGPALLFARVRGCRFPMLGNLFGTIERARFLFRDSLEGVEQLVRAEARSGCRHCGSRGGWPTPLAARPACLPKLVSRGEVTANETTISQLPQQISWPDDGGAFITLPQVYTEDVREPGLRRSNLGMYRVQLSGNRYELGSRGRTALPDSPLDRRASRRGAGGRASRFA